MPKKCIIIYSLLLLLFCSYAGAQTVVHGVLHSSKGGGIAGATVTISHSPYGASTDSTGAFSFSTPLHGRHVLVFSALGYRRDSTAISIKGDSLNVIYKLKDSENVLSGVTVAAHRKVDNIDLKKGMVLNAFEAATTAGAIADIASALRTLPGAAPESNQTGFYVQGGDARETGAYMDGLLLKNPFGSRLPDISNRSRFTPFMFKDLTFSTGGYSAQYGQALSSLLVLNTKDLPEKTSNEFTLVTVGGGGAHTERMKNSAYMIGANYYNFSLNDNVVPQNVDWVKNPEQEQLTFQYKWKPDMRSMFKFLADYSDTRLSLNIFDPDSMAYDYVKNINKNLYLNTNYEGYFNNIKIQTGASYNKTYESGYINAQPYYQDDDVVQGRLALSKNILKRSDITAGGDIFSNRRAEGYGAINRIYYDVLSAGYVESNLWLSNKLSARVGARGEYDSYLDDFTLAPRTTFIYKTGRHSQVLASYGIFYEKPDDSYLTQTSNIGEEKATHYMLSYEYNVDSRTFRIESYYKRYADLTKLSTNQYSGLRGYGPVIINGFTDGGTGYARGFDIFWRDKTTIPLGEYYVSYSYVDSKRNYLDYPVSARPPFAPEHTFNIVARKYFPQYKTQLSATYTFSSGRTYYNPDNPVFLSDKTQVYNTLSTTISYLPGWQNKFTVINFTVTNIPGFNQVYGYRYAANGSNRVPILPTARRNFVLTLLMNFGDSTFNY